jgi:hypothetical protein
MSSAFIAFVAAAVRGGGEEHRIEVLLGRCGARCRGGLRPSHRRAPVVFRFHLLRRAVLGRVGSYGETAPASARCRAGGVDPGGCGAT